MILIDSDHFSVIANQRDRKHSKLVARLGACDDIVGVPIVVVEEVLRGRLAKLRRIQKLTDLITPYEQLGESIRFLSNFVVAPWNAAAAERMAALKGARLRVGTQDLRIASIALAQDALLISANLVDFEQVPKLRVENWMDT